jgi:septal ring factor EnvC (AmiA/AmiB activator)
VTAAQHLSIQLDTAKAHLRSLQDRLRLTRAEIPFLEKMVAEAEERIAKLEEAIAKEQAASKPD